MPSKTLAASARAADRMRHADRYGLEPVEPIDRPRRRLATRPCGAGRDRRLGRGSRAPRPTSASSCSTGTPASPARTRSPSRATCSTRRYVLVCTGSRPRTLDLPGLGAAETLTTDSLFALDQPPPSSLAIIGGGPVGVELAQALARLDVAVTLLQRGPQLLRREEPALVARLTERLRADGVAVHLDADVRRRDRWRRPPDRPCPRRRPRAARRG